MEQRESFFQEIIQRFAGRRIAVLGDVMLDRYIQGRVNRISPEAPVPVVEVETETERLGGAANVAFNLASLNAQVHLVGVIGDDEAGARLRSVLHDYRIGTEGLLMDSNRPTSCKTRILARHQQIVRIDREKRQLVAPPILADIIRYLGEILDECDALIISDYGKGLIQPELCRAALEFCQSSQIFSAVDPKQSDFSIYAGADMMTPNHREAGLPYRINIESEQDLLAVGRRILKDYGFRSLLITRGEEGMTLFEAPDTVIHLPAVAREVFDVSGAGDTVISVLTLCRASGCSLKLSATIANHAAGIVVGKLGTAAVSAAELLDDLAYRAHIHD
ncbi:MAG: D-glycero-beta-D-manno-heptose-7-phosphate kinase [Candidatus Delongbacteria bacterium]|nr:D-glycero-beta-D-manno-heptose-7-phosphate kinase [Candidatus Delongbacteria bacterium]